MDRVHVLADESLGEFAAVVSVRTNDGKEFAANISETLGSPAFPLSEAQLMAKFVDCATTVVSQEQAKRAGHAIMDMENERDMSRLTEMLSHDSKSL